MLIPLNDIPGEGLDIALKDEDFDLGTGEELVTSLAPVEFEVHLDRIGQNVLASGHLSTMVGLTCSRCLRVFSLKIEEDFRVAYQRKERTLEGEHELMAGELDVEFLEGDEIDVNNLIRENIILGLPLQPLCIENCQGLCPKCGQNLNEGHCQCVRQGEDPRFQILKKLLKES